MLALAAGEAQLGDRRGGVFEQPFAVAGVGPGLGDHPCAVAGADLGFEVVDDGVQRRGIDQPLLDQQ